jgi:hypothetical protein
MRFYHLISHLPVAYPAGHDNVTPVHPHPHIPSRHKERITVMAVLAAELAIDTDPLAHGNPAGERNVTVAPFGVFAECFLCLREQDADPFLCHHLCCGVL